MSDILSILDEEPAFGLKATKNDLIAQVIKMIGGPFGEIVASIIPDQKIDRIVDFVEIWAEKVRTISAEQVDSNLDIGEMADLVEDAINQASRALSPKRRAYIASVLKNSLTKKDILYLNKKRLLETLGKLNDIEILLLQSRGLWATEEEEFYERHKAIWEEAEFDATPEEFSGETLLEEYQSNLKRLNLVDDRKQLTHFGQLMLIQLEMDRESRNPGDF